MSETLTPYLSTDDNDGRLGVLQLLCRHLVGIQGTYKHLDRSGTPSGQTYFFNYSSWLMVWRQQAFLVTAGHVLEELDDLFGHEGVCVECCHLVDYFGPNPKSLVRIPFDYERSHRIAVHRDGLDFALIHLPQNTFDLLVSNGIVPISEKNWIHQNGIDFDRFMLVGFPNELHDTEEIDGVLWASASPMLVWGEVISKERKREDHRFGRFVGRLKLGESNTNIQGLSGGPIIAFERDGGAKAYWVVAVQSKWDKQKGIVFGCPVPVFMAWFEKAILESA